MARAAPALVTAWSYSRFNDYDTCPAKFKYKHIDRLPDPSGPAAERGTLIHKKAEDYTTGRIKVIPLELKHFQSQFAELKKLDPLVEQNWGFKADWSWIGRQGWFGDDVWFRAKADAAVVYDDDTGDVIDHKTGQKYGSNEDQVGLMALATKLRFPKLTHVTARLWYLDQREDNEVIFEFTAAELAAIKADWTKKVVPMFVDRKFPPKPNSKCVFCNYSARKGGPCKY